MKLWGGSPSISIVRRIAQNSFAGRATVGPTNMDKHFLASSTIVKTDSDSQELRPLIFTRGFAT